MKDKAKRPSQLDELFPKIRDYIEKERYRESRHARDRKVERNIGLSDVLYVLKNGYHEKQKTSFDENLHVWKYAVRGKTLEGFDIRIITAFDEDGMLIITVMHVLRGGEKP
jgi:hypothetical protein